MLRLLPRPAEVVDEVPVGRLYRDGKLIVPSVEGPVKERRRLSYAGIVCVAVALDRHGEVASDPEIALDGLPERTLDGRTMEEHIFNTVDGTLESIPMKRRKDDKLVADAVKRAVRAAVDQAWGKKPIVKVLVCLV
jgi:ribonuclease J